MQGDTIERLPSLLVDHQYRLDIRHKNISPIIRSHHDGYTVSHPNCEVKHRWAQSVLRWGTTRESWVSNVVFVFLRPNNEYARRVSRDRLFWAKFHRFFATFPGQNRVSRCFGSRALRQCTAPLSGSMALPTESTVGIPLTRKERICG